MTLDARTKLTPAVTGTDSNWVKAARAGDEDAFRELYQRYIGRTYALCFRLCSDKSSAEEMTQEAFIRAWQKLPKLDDDKYFGAWLKRLTINLVLDQHHGRISWWQRWRGTELEERDHPQVTEHAGTQRDLEGLLRKLPERARQVFVLFAIEGYSHREIAEMMSTSENTSKAQYHRARTLLQEWWK